MTKQVRLARRPVPTVEVPPPPPPLPAALYRERLAAACARARAEGLGVLAVYGDREHSANLAYLTGFDPRFEEALLLLSTDGRGKLLVGNECMGYAPDPALGLEVELFQEFSLLGQPRDRSRPLRTILREFGLAPGVRAGAVGWKYFDGALVPARSLDVPAYLADLLREICGADAVTNATALFMDAETGLRAVCEPPQLARFEYAACVTAAGVLDAVKHLAEGVAEWELERLLDSRGLPLSCHRMISAGAKVRRGLSSPSANLIRRGDPYVVAFGVAGGLTCRAGCAARGPEDLAEDLRGFYDDFAANYFSVVAAWYETLRVGAAGDEVWRAVEAVRDPRLFTFAVNPGHQLHLDEWLHSPFAAGSAVRLTSGMVLQMDIIPQSVGPFCYINAEDGVALADERLRETLSTSLPGFWARIERRREAVRELLGVALDPSVLPLSDLTAWLPPYALEPGRVLTRG